MGKRKDRSAGEAQRSKEYYKVLGCSYYTTKKLKMQ